MRLAALWLLAGAALWAQNTCLDCHSALEGLCIEVHGNHRSQLVRQLITAALTMAGNGATYANFAACDAVCQDAGATAAELSDCIDEVDAFNQSGDNVTAPFDPPGAAEPAPCEAAFATSCTVLSPGGCSCS